MSNFCTPLPPFSVCPNGSKLGKTPASGCRNLGHQLSLPPTSYTHTHTHTHIPIPFGIYAADRLYLVDVSITYHDRATHNSLQIKINLN